MLDGWPHPQRENDPAFTGSSRETRATWRPSTRTHDVRRQRGEMDARSAEASAEAHLWCAAQASDQATKQTLAVAASRPGRRKLAGQRCRSPSDASRAGSGGGRGTGRWRGDRTVATPDGRDVHAGPNGAGRKGRRFACKAPPHGGAERWSSIRQRYWETVRGCFGGQGARDRAVGARAGTSRDELARREGREWRKSDPRAHARQV